MPKKILAVAECRDGSIKRPSYEVIAAARTLADGGEVHALVVGSGVAGELAGLGAHGASTVHHCDTDNVTVEHVAKVAQAVIAGGNPDAVLFPATMAGKDVAAAVAAALDVPLATDCTEVRGEGDGFAATRPVLAGKAIATVTASAKPFLASIRRNAYAVDAGAGSGDASVDTVAPASEGLRTTLGEVTKQESARPDVAEAEIVVSGGRSLGSAENFEILEKLADAIGPNCGVGASRAAVDAGYRPHRDQVGQTGKTVSPALYFAFGISGAIQHLAGMSSSKVIVAVNKDADAPIFKVSDYGIVGDLFEVAPALTEAIGQLER